MPVDSCNLRRCKTTKDTGETEDTAKQTNRSFWWLTSIVRIVTDTPCSPLTLHCTKINQTAKRHRQTLPIIRLVRLPIVVSATDWPYALEVELGVPNCADINKTAPISGQSKQKTKQTWIGRVRSILAD